MTAAPGGPVLDVRDLRVRYHGDGEPVQAVDGVSLTVGAGEVVCVVGESGSGKSATAYAILRLIPRRQGAVAGSVLLGDRDLMRLGERAMRNVRGRAVGLVLQDPGSALNPVLTVGDQIGEVLRHHLGLGRAAARSRVLELLRMVEIPEPAARLDAYPHQLSGGMRQRVMIAIAVSCEPALVIADEPTTALDVTVQAQILALLRRLARRTGAGVLVITHNLGVVASVADRVAVMYAGRIVEEGPVERVLARPLHPYAEGLLDAVPRLSAPRAEWLKPIAGSPPAPGAVPAGCRFRPRCPIAEPRCERDDPGLVEGETAHRVACWARTGASVAGRERG